MDLKIDPSILKRKISLRRNSIIIPKTSFLYKKTISDLYQHKYQKKYSKAPQYVMDEMYFLKFVASLLYYKHSASEKEILTEFHICNDISFNSLFNNTPLYFILDYRDGLYYDNENEVWYCDHYLFTKYIHNLHLENIKEYGDDYI